MTDPIDLFVASTLARACGRTCVLPETKLAALGVDSLVLLTLVLHVEATYGCAFDAADMLNLVRCECVADIAKLAAGLASREPARGYY